MTKTRWILVAVAVLGVAIFFVVRNRKAEDKAADAKEAKDKVRAVPVVATLVVKRDVPLYLEGLGTALANKTVTVRPLVDGRLDLVLFREGQDVKRGMQLAQIDPRPFEIQLHTAEGAKARDESQLAAARLDLKRYQELVQNKLVAQQQVDTQAALVGQLEGGVRIDQAQIDAARLNLDYAKILAPIDGVTGIRQIDPGNVVHAADPGGLVVIAALDPIAVTFTLPQDEFASVAGALQGSELAVEAWSRDGSVKMATGKLALIDNQINQNTATLKLKALIPNPLHTIWPNQFLKARLLVSTRRDALVVPSTAVQRGPSGTFAWVIGSDQTVQARPIDVERTQGDTSILSKGLEAGDSVVIEGQAQLRAGAKVQARIAGQAGAATGQAQKKGPQARGQEGRALGSAP
jgi:membrane fusion protein, multidrug efflux system